MLESSLKALDSVLNADGFNGFEGGPLKQVALAPVQGGLTRQLIRRLRGLSIPSWEESRQNSKQCLALGQNRLGQA